MTRASTPTVLLRHGVSVDNDPGAGPEVVRLLDSGYVKVFGSLKNASTGLHFSKVAMITKEKDGCIKRRLIMDY